MSLGNKSVSNMELTKDELEIEYNNLKTQNNCLTKQIEECMQQLYETKRKLDTCNAMEEHLLSEIETLQAVKCSVENSSHKVILLEEEIANLKKETENIVQNYESQLLSKDNEIKTMSENFNSKQKLYESSTQSEIEKCREDIINLQAQKELLIETLNENEDRFNAVVKENSVLTNKISELSNEIEELKQCLEARSDEVRECKEFIQNLQDEQIVLQVEVQKLRDVPVEKAEKGNSLFAELEDSRQELKKYVNTMNQKYSELKFKYNNKVDELQKLNLEYKSLAKVLEDNKDAIESKAELIDGYKRHINKLLETVKHLENEMHLRRNQYVKLMSGDMQSAETLIEFTRKEVLKLRKDLLTESFAVNVKEEALYEAKMEISKWRAEAMRLRATLINLRQDIEDKEIKELNKEEPETQYVGQSSYHLQTLSPIVYFDKEYKDSSFMTEGNFLSVFSVDADLGDVSVQDVSNKFKRYHDTSDNLSGYFEDCIFEKPVLTERNPIFEENRIEKQDAETPKPSSEDEKEIVVRGKFDVENNENKSPEKKEGKSKKVAFAEGTSEPKLTNRPKRGGKILVVPCVHIPSVTKK